MKRLCVLFIVMMLLLCACGGESGVESTTAPTDAQTQSSVSWLKDQGMPWDSAGAVVEIPLTIPGGMHYANYMEFDGDLLLWSLDEHRLDQTTLELCLVELDDGSILAQRDIEVTEFTMPQPLKDKLYICDSMGGRVLMLGKDLKDESTWHLEQNAHEWYFGGGNRVYQIIDGQKLWAYDLENDHIAPVFEEDPQLETAIYSGDYLSLEYYDPNTGASRYAALDLITGEIIRPEAAESYDYIHISGNTWISGKYTNKYIYRISAKGSEPMQVLTDDKYAELLSQDRMVLYSDDGQYLHLYDLAGNPISSCQISENSYYSVSDMIWNENQGGYFMFLYAYENNYRLLFWDISSQPLGSDLTVAPIPEPSEQEAALLQRCDDLGKEYGLSILIGESCNTEFFDFTAEYATDWDEVAMELDTLEEALENYPKDFFRQLHYDTVHGIEIQLIQNLNSYEGSSYTDTYTAFVQDEWDKAVVVVDIYSSDVSTYYHEFSHVIDTYLEWDSWHRDDALFSNEKWESYNPEGFEGYTYDYSRELDYVDYTYFVDTYSSINPTEDRARVMEYAMTAYGIWTFEDAPGLLNKLDYYSRCMRDAFDTEGWDETVLWEQYLYLKK